jgi:catechol 2,3-dioxygenase-like lactoylglutathione lyase family enzyme
VRILDVRLRVAEAAEEATRRFYRDELGLPAEGDGVRIGQTTLEFAPAADAGVFYHFALRAPSSRFAAARDWAAGRAEILDETRFENWNAEACYFEDPAGNIVELIAHGDLPEEGSEGPFRASELLGICELGLVGPDTPSMAAALASVGIELSDGSLAPGSLAFMGARDGVLILCPVGRGWMPTGRPAGPHPVEATVAGSRDAEVALPGTQHRIRTVPDG